jgi:hypothetical protein
LTPHNPRIHDFYDAAIGLQDHNLGEFAGIDLRCLAADGFDGLLE